MTPRSVDVSSFERCFGVRPELACVAPGRVNLIGEHTDYNQGWVMPVALPLVTRLLAARRAGNRLRVESPQHALRAELEIASLERATGTRFGEHVRGAARLLERELGVTLEAADLLIEGDLPLGAGLSSSAALSVGLLLTLARLHRRELDKELAAGLALRLEHEFLGVQCGIMDPLAVLFARPGCALLIDCRSEARRSIAWDPRLALAVLDTGTRRELADGGLNARRRECDAALAELRKRHSEIRSLRDVEPSMLVELEASLAPIGARRVRHVVRENQRVLDFARALETCAFAEAGALLDASHRSLRDDYDVSTAALDAIVDAARSVTGVLGARLTGAGFGGCAIALLDTTEPEAAVLEIVRRFRAESGLPAAGFAFRPSGGAEIAALP